MGQNELVEKNCFSSDDKKLSKTVLNTDIFYQILA